jgi:hypothetical protein
MHSEFVTEELEGLHQFTEVQRRLEAAIATVRQRIHVAENSRAALWARELDRLSVAGGTKVLSSMIPDLRDGSWSHPYAKAFRALVDSRMFLIIVEELNSQLTESDLRDLVAGNFHTASDKPGKRTRDREFELFISAIALRARLSASLQEPDSVISIDGTSWAVAAKRLGSPKQVEQNIKNAALQIERAGLPGFIMLDVTQLIDPEGIQFTHWRLLERDTFSICLGASYGQSFRVARNALVRGIVLRCVLPHISENRLFGSNEVWRPMPIGDLDAIDVHSFFRRMAVGLKAS